MTDILISIAILFFWLLLGAGVAMLWGAMIGVGEKDEHNRRVLHG